MSIDIHSLDDRTRAVLSKYGFDSIPFSNLVQRLKTGGLSAEANEGVSGF